MAMETLDGGAPLGRVVDALERDGCVILSGLADKGVIDGVERELEPYLARTPNCEGTFWGHRTKRSGGLVKKSKSCWPLVTERLVLDAVGAVLGPFCDRFQISLTQAMRILPGERAQILHADDEVFPVPRGDGEYIVNALWALDDFTTENGATRVLVGSHKGEIDRFAAPDKIEHAEMARGSVLIYRGSLVHGGGANTTNAPRTGIAISYSLGWLRQVENQYLVIPPEIAKELPGEIQKLLGYTIHRPNLGWYEGRDPGVVLTGQASDAMATQDHLLDEHKALLEELYRAA